GALQEWLRVGAGDDGNVHRLRRPVAVVPPQDVARVELDVSGAHAALVAVEEVEPVPLPGQRALDSLDRLQVAAAVPRRDLQLALDRANAVLARRNGPGEDDVRAPVARHPQRRRPVPARVRTAAGEDEREQQEGGESHLTALERIAPVAVARTSRPVCLPGQYAVPVVPGAVFFEPTCHVSPVTLVAFALSSNAVAV